MDKLDSPPIQMSTIGVLRDKTRQSGSQLKDLELFELLEKEKQWENLNNNFKPSVDNTYLVFGSPVIMENSAGLINVDIPPLGFLDAIVEVKNYYNISFYIHKLVYAYGLIFFTYISYLAYF